MFSTCTVCYTPSGAPVADPDGEAALAVQAACDGGPRGRALCTLHQTRHGSGPPLRHGLCSTATCGGQWQDLHDQRQLPQESNHGCHTEVCYGEES